MISGENVREKDSRSMKKQLDRVSNPGRFDP
jgi:hypothetical protein